MKRTDLTVGTVYAHNSDRNPTYASAVKLLDTQLWKTDRRGLMTQAAEGDRARQISYYHGAIGLKVMRVSNGTIFLAQPRHLHMSWDAWLLEEKRQREERRKALRKQREDMQRVRALNAEIEQELNRIGETGLHFDRLNSEVLLRILRRVP